MYPESSTACTKTSQMILDREGDPDNEFSPIVLVDRGNCTFIRKTRNVQELGGALCLVVNNIPGQNPERIIMIDDGTGLNVAIPTIMISKEDGDLIKNAIVAAEINNRDRSRKTEYVVLFVDFEMVLASITYSIGKT